MQLRSSWWEESCWPSAARRTRLRGLTESAYNDTAVRSHSNQGRRACPPIAVVRAGRPAKHARQANGEDEPHVPPWRSMRKPSGVVGCAGRSGRHMMRALAMAYPFIWLSRPLQYAAFAGAVSSFYNSPPSTLGVAVLRLAFGTAIFFVLHWLHLQLFRYHGSPEVDSTTNPVDADPYVSVRRARDDPPRTTGRLDHEDDHPIIEYFDGVRPHPSGETRVVDKTDDGVLVVEMALLHDLDARTVRVEAWSRSADGSLLRTCRCLWSRRVAMVPTHVAVPGASSQSRRRDHGGVGEPASHDAKRTGGRSAKRYRGVGSQRRPRELRVGRVLSGVPWHPCHATGRRCDVGMVGCVHRGGDARVVEHRGTDGRKPCDRSAVGQPVRMEAELVERGAGRCLRWRQLHACRLGCSAARAHRSGRGAPTDHRGDTPRSSVPVREFLVLGSTTAAWVDDPVSAGQERVRTGAPPEPATDR